MRPFALLVLLAFIPFARAGRPDDAEAVEALQKRAEELGEKKQYKEAAEAFAKAAELSLKVHGDKHDTTAYLTNHLATNLEAAGEIDKAEAAYLRTIVLRNNIKQDNVDAAYAMVGLSGIYVDKGQFDKAEEFLKKALSLRTTQLERDHPETLDTLVRLADLQSTRGRNPEAEAIYKDATARMEAKLGKDHVDLVRPLIGQAWCLRTAARFTAAEPLYQRAMAIAEANAKDNPETLGGALVGLMEFHAAVGRFAKAVEDGKRALALYDKLNGEDSVEAARIYRNIGSALMDLGKFGPAAESCRKAEEVYLKRLGAKHVDYADALYNTGRLHMLLDQSDRALEKFQRAIDIRESAFGRNSLPVADALNALGVIQHQKKQLKEAESLLNQALAIGEALRERDDLENIFPVSNLGILYRETGRFDKAEEALGRALAVRSRKLGADSVEAADSGVELGKLHIRTGAFAKARPLFDAAVETYRAKLGKDHPSVAEAVALVGELHAMQGNKGEAVRTLDRALRSMRLHSSSVLPLMNEAEQLKFLEENYNKRLRSGLSLAGDPALGGDYRHRIAAWVLNGKAVAQESLAERLILARDNNTPEARKALAALEEVRGEISKATVSGKEADRVKELRAKEKELDRILHAFDARERREDPWYDLDEVRQKLSPKARFIDIVRFEPVDFKERDPEKAKLPARYTAFLTAPEGDVTIVDLGPAEAIEKAVAAVRKELAGAAARIKAEGEPAAEKALKGPLAALGKLALQPLLPHLGEAEEWIVSPDAALWLVPWNILPLADGKYAVEKARIRYVVSGRDLLLSPLKFTGRKAEPTVFTDPDYDLGSVPGKTIPLEEFRGLSRDLSLGKVQRLPGTAVEAEAVLPRLNAFANAKSKVLADKEATVTAFRAVNSPRFMLLSTHGFFLEDSHADRAVAPENPLLRCGLLMAGCNNAARAKPGEDSGVLTGLDIIGTDLRGTEMVVLSACETGLGEVRNGEGVAGLRQAFQLAGAESVVATLWQVPDVQSAQLVVGFFDNLGRGQTRDEALRNAQLEQIEKRRGRNNAAHPLFWAAYTLTGSPK